MALGRAPDPALVAPGAVIGINTAIFTERRRRRPPDLRYTVR